jgi:fluoride exporter
MKEVILVFIGGGFGSIARFSIGKWITSIHTQHFPYGTLVVNVIACLILGLVIGLVDHRQFISASTRLFWTVGFCGGFSTFSTFSAETISLLQNGFYPSTVFYITASLLFCITATYIGLYLGSHT